MSNAVMTAPYAHRRAVSIEPTISGVENYALIGDVGGVLDTEQLLNRLKEVGARNVDMARVLGLPDSRIAEIKGKRRALKLDEAAKLVRHYKLDEPANPLTTPVARLIVQHLARSLGNDVADSELEELAEDLRAFSAFASDPRVRSSSEAAETFFRSLEIRRATTAS